jgi:hypothetical protein
MIKTFTLSILLGLLVITSAVLPHDAFSQSSQRFAIKINQNVFAPGDTLILYGKAAPADALFVKLSDPANKTVRVDNIVVDNNTGSFTEQVFQWPQPSKNFVFGTYTIQVISSRFLSDKATFSVAFGEPGTSATTQTAPGHILAVKLDSPTEISAGKPFRIYVQVTFDGALVNTATNDELVSLLGSSHIHSGNTTVNLSGKFLKLHEGIYYTDVQLGEGSYIIHAIAFYKGFLAHDSKVVSSGASIGDINQSVGTLRAELDRTSHELNDTRTSVTKSVEDARLTIKGDVDQLQSASGQINSLILPILALISVIIALQISLFARIRASFR